MKNEEDIMKYSKNQIRLAAVAIPVAAFLFLAIFMLVTGGMF
jgi:hypothetical protein